MRQQKIIYYSDELNDEFAGDNITTVKIDKDYDYHGTVARKIGRILLYRIFAVPVGWIMLKIKYGHRIYGREKLKGYRSYFLYGNHTNNLADPFIPSMISAPHGTYVIVHPNNVSMPVLGKLTPCLGALPLPGDMESTRHFLEEIDLRYRQGNSITIYPEAHIWPFYTKIRPFKDMSFRYPVQLNAPVFCFTNVYKKRKWRQTPRMITYVDGPFMADSTRPAKEQKAVLRGQVYDAMVNRSAENNIEVIKYIRRETHD